MVVDLPEVVSESRVGVVLSAFDQDQCRLYHHLAKHQMCC